MQYEFELTMLVVFLASLYAAWRMMRWQAGKDMTELRATLTAMATFATCYIGLSALLLTLSDYGVNPIGLVFDQLVGLLS
ncbi:MAG: hypothetical protein AAGM84_18075 [Pseudomonadota bacterium]